MIDIKPKLNWIYKAYKAIYLKWCLGKDDLDNTTGNFRLLKCDWSVRLERDRDVLRTARMQVANLRGELQLVVGWPLESHDV